MVVGFQHIEKKTLADVERIPGKFDYYCWDLYARVGEFYAASPENEGAPGRGAAPDRGRRQRHGPARRARGAARIVDCHLATMARLGDPLRAAGARERHPEAALLGPRLRAAAARRAPSGWRREGKNQGCWVLPMAEGEAEAIDEDKIIVRSNGTVTYTGKDIAYQLWKLGKLDRDFRYRVASARAGRPSCSGPRPAARARPDAPHFGHASAVYNVIDVGQSYPQRVVRAGVAALGHEQGGPELPPPRLREGRALARHGPSARLRGQGRRHVRQGLRAQGARRQGRRPAGRARGQGAGRGRGARPRARRRGPRGHGAGGRGRRAALLHAALLPHPHHHLRHGGGARLHRRDRPLPAERGGARPQHLRQARGRGPRAVRAHRPRALARPRRPS